MARDYILLGMKIGERGQVTIPKQYRRHFGLEPSTAVEFVEVDGNLVIRKSGSPQRRNQKRKAYGILGAKDRRSDEIMNALRGL